MNIVEEVRYLEEGDNIPEGADEYVYVRLISAYKALANSKEAITYRERINPYAHMEKFDDLMYMYLETNRDEFIESQIVGKREELTEKEFHELVTDLGDMWDHESSYSYFLDENDLIETIYNGNLCCMNNIEEAELFQIEIMNSPQVLLINDRTDCDYVLMPEADFYEAGVFY